MGLTMNSYCFPAARFETDRLLVVAPGVNSITGTSGAPTARTTSTYDCGMTSGVHKTKMADELRTVRVIELTGKPANKGGREGR